MAQKDWEEVQKIIENKSPGFLEKFLTSDEIFLPNNSLPNSFNVDRSNFSASDLGKDKPGQWIPVYYLKDISEYFRENNIVPVRAGPAEFFFYKGVVFFDLESIVFENIDTEKIAPIESYIPVTLKAKFQRNENAYLNKAVALGYINHFVDDGELSVFEKEIETGNRKRLLYGQFGKIKLTDPLQFKTTIGSKTVNPGFQFEIDLVLENKDEIIIFEAKTGGRPFKNFSLLQLYYPLIYLRSIIKEPKPIRTIFIDITTVNDSETYRLLEVRFNNDMFDEVEVSAACEYKHRTE
ncbi:DUF6997 domain-containing protein [Sulfurovum riftiae]|uniref:DUF6997 domain-containing protein n=1 Tax=Sulfurovum riftiae TaxID=1630136 RepID=A0A151CJ39_9BACT|nr:hypothetical protein [Sulfurovum riftiae]KYJ87552.1 hypothetical protein AS592_10645 [Sulfurovum riftiae]